MSIAPENNGFGYDRPWRAKIPWLFLVAALTAMICVEAAMLSIMCRFGHRIPEIIQEAVIQSMGLAAILAIFAAIHPVRHLPDKLGIGFPRWRDIGIAALGLCMIYAWQIVVTPCWKELLDKCGLSFEEHQELIVECSEASPKHFLAMLVIVGVLIPIIEEVVFRRVLYGAILPLGILPAMLLTALIFSAAHGFLQGLPALFGLGLVFQWQYLHSRNLVTPMITHMTFNIISLVLAFALGLD